MTVLITGAGLLGQEVAKRLSERGESLVLVDIRQPENFPEDLPGMRFVELDVTDAKSLFAIAHETGVNQIIHTAAVLSNGLRANPLLGLKVNLMGTANILELARTIQARRTVTISSATVVYSGFGAFDDTPIPEDASLRMLSDRPKSLYAATKVAGENLGMLYRDLYGVSHVSLRLAAVIGGDATAPSSVPGQLLATLVTAAKSGKHCALDNPLFHWGGTEEFVDLRDCADAVIAALDADDPKLGTYTIAHSKLWTLSDVVNSVERIFGEFTCDLPNGVTTGFAGFPFQRPAASDTSASEHELGFRCKHDLNDTLTYWFTS